jgi:uncharacterized RDD family membrane protein YckC
VASILDSILYGAPLVPGFLMAGGARGDQEATAVAGAVLVGGALITLAICLYQWVKLSTTGQTLGKRWMGVRVVRVDGQPIGFGSAVVLRVWLPTLLQAVPLLGPLFGLVDVLWIFGQERRCVHDLMAGTRVVDASAPSA